MENSNVRRFLPVAMIAVPFVVVSIAVLVLGDILDRRAGRPPAGGSFSASAPASVEATIDLEVTVIQEGMSLPWDIAFAPDGRMFVSERPGRIKIFASGEPGAELLAEVPVEHARAFGEAGVMGMAVDRDFENFPFLYVCASRDEDGEAGPADWVNQLLRYRITDSGIELEGTVFDDVIFANRQHNGCAVEVDASGHIWMTTGDNLGGRRGISQDPSRLNGKVLRLNRDGTVPNDNPTYPGMDGPSFVVSVGHRNPQGLGFQPGTGNVYTAEHGPTRDDEVNNIVPGTNRGWPCYTGVANPPDDLGGQEALNIECGPATDYLPPAWASGTPTLATSGLTFLVGDQWGPWEGNIVVSTLRESDIRRFEVNPDGSATLVEVLLDEEFGRKRAAVIGPDGSLYISTSNSPNRSRKDLTPEPERNNDYIIRIRPVRAD
jgi:glucose/arabinose dehydrogenase